ncbi:Ada metal-binding domain-containing protein [Poritiphilus flavus]|uniref:Metal-binding protein n=1 Tax=Poritiphilus flavus TaxID=2697053 RepID=A0A6L9EE73_9FLAO|nr:Ada metal-binding domain-containing protein [Poritiphilus flavus]NAS13025.1 metal-binding protein [Poritiphilus flavus]
MIAHSELSPQLLREKIKEGSITLGGNRKLKIYGRLRCKSGKRMKEVNRVFFSNEKQAKEMGYRPCGHCMRREYSRWKEENIT